eukprot:GHVS01088350.1.p1 GENE.GHVS01088350.1~~GHVS01088350.1.p1  ORF type:complete len:221 (+),score=59.69 GHVS01088350.1:15-677(+)
MGCSPMMLFVVVAVCVVVVSSAHEEGEVISTEQQQQQPMSGHGFESMASLIDYPSTGSYNRFPVWPDIHSQPMREIWKECNRWVFSAEIYNDFAYATRDQLGCNPEKDWLREAREVVPSMAYIDELMSGEQQKGGDRRRLHDPAELGEGGAARRLQGREGGGMDSSPCGLAVQKQLCYYADKMVYCMLTTPNEFQKEVQKEVLEYGKLWVDHSTNKWNCT